MSKFDPIHTGGEELISRTASVDEFRDNENLYLLQASWIGSTGASMHEMKRPDECYARRVFGFSMS